MKLYPNIEFSNNLIENEETTITYSGYLFQNNSDSVTIVYGFGNSWNNTTELEMQKNENGFSAKVKALEFSNFNFCFRNSNYQWDNNNYQNYTAPISKPKLNEAFIINENVIENIMNDILEYDVSQIKNDTQSKISEEQEIVNTIEDFEIDIKNDEPIDIESSAVNITEEASLAKDIEQVFNDLYSKVDSDNETETNLENNSENSELNINSLIDEILSPVEESTSFNEDTYTVSEENIIPDNSIEESEEDEQVNTLINDLIENLYENVNSNLELSSKININDNFSENIINDLTNNSENILEDELSNTNEDNLEINISNIIENIENNPINDEDFNFENEIQEEINNSINEFSEDSLFDNLNSNTKVDDSNALIEIDNDNELVVSARSLSKFYLLKKKIKLAFYKLLSLPKKIISNLGPQNN